MFEIGFCFEARTNLTIEIYTHSHSRNMVKYPFSSSSCSSSDCSWLASECADKAHQDKFYWSPIAPKSDHCQKLRNKLLKVQMIFSLQSKSISKQII
ncbi:hypothetical protein BpHYR1_050529 [Brachionus plicatilis]|uniref:Uncharacterized protein n=1 Tax=Brachionus plicatilis TaxID=10195 RepID=A0A3M7R025_BRAPC|nr:hypothetical protein BpHYR1_050529 [Brachionus plicatilis]